MNVRMPCVVIFCVHDENINKKNLFLFKPSTIFYLIMPFEVHT